MVAIPMLLAFGVSAMGTAFTFYESKRTTHLLYS